MISKCFQIIFNKEKISKPTHIPHSHEDKSRSSVVMLRMNRLHFLM